MKFVRCILCLAICLFIFCRSNGQNQLRLRFGASKSFKSGKNTGLDMTSGHKSPLPSGFGLEYYRSLPSKKTSLLFGVFGEMQRYSGGLNPAKFPPGVFLMRMASTYGSIKVYGGIEKVLNKVTRPNANTISAVGGVAIGINVLGLDEDITYPGRKVPVQTKDGNTYEPIAPKENSGMISSLVLMRQRVANLFTPELFGGLRWNIKNHHAKTVFLAEGIVNYSLLPKASIEFPYTLNAKPMVDKINDHGFNAQVNVLIPVKTFWKKHKK